MIYIENRSIGCNQCGYTSVPGQEYRTPNRDGSTLVECKWVCPRCCQLVRADERIEPKAEIKQEIKKDAK